MKRFAFYGRVSTEDQQDPTSSRGWQLARSTALIEQHGVVVAEYFDVGQSRSLPWKRRPEAARLLSDLARPDRGFDAVVIGEPARAFYGAQFGLTFPVLTHYGVELWVPEVGGRVDPGSDAHELVMSLVEVSREQRRVCTRRHRVIVSALHFWSVRPLWWPAFSKRVHSRRSASSFFVVFQLRIVSPASTGVPLLLLPDGEHTEHPTHTRSPRRAANPAFSGLSHLVAPVSPVNPHRRPTCRPTFRQRARRAPRPILPAHALSLIHI